MFDLSTMAGRLRVVKQAHRDFLTFWAIEQALDRPEVADRLFRDIEDACEKDPFGRLIRLHRRGPIADTEESWPQ